MAWCLAFFALATSTVVRGDDIKIKDGRTFTDAKIVEIKAHSIILWIPRGGNYEFKENELMPESLAKVKDKMAAVAQAEADAAEKSKAQEAKWAKEEAERKAGIVPSKKVDITLNNGTTLRGVTVVEYGPDFVKVAHEGGLAKVLFSELSSDWREKLKPTMTKVATEDAQAAWERRVGEMRTRQEAETEKLVKLKITGKHLHGTRAVMTEQIKVGKKTTTRLTDVLVEGLPPSKTGLWSGVLVPNGVYAERSSDTLLPRWRVK